MRSQTLVVIPSQIRSIHSLELRLDGMTIKESRNPFSNQVNSLIENEDFKHDPA